MIARLTSQGLEAIGRAECGLFGRNIVTVGEPPDPDELVMVGIDPCSHYGDPHRFVGRFDASLKQFDPLVHHSFVDGIASHLIHD